MKRTFASNLQANACETGTISGLLFMSSVTRRMESRSVKNINKKKSLFITVAISCDHRGHYYIVVTTNLSPFKTTLFRIIFCGIRICLIHGNCVTTLYLVITKMLWLWVTFSFRRKTIIFNESSIFSFDLTRIMKLLKFLSDANLAWKKNFR